MTNFASAIAARTRQNETDIEVLTSMRLSSAAGGAVSVYSISGDTPTGADTDLVALPGLAWTFVPGGVYEFSFIGTVQPAAATTGCGFCIAVS